DDRKHYKVDGRLKDGTPVHLRSVTPQDKAGLDKLFHRLSARSVYYRFFQTPEKLSDKQLSSFTELDFKERAAIVAIDPKGSKDEIIGVGRYAVIHGSSPVRADIAFAVEDRFQGRGIGTLLLEHLTTLAEAAGVVEFEAQVLGENNRMLEVFAKSGFDLSRSVQEGVVTVKFGTHGGARFQAESFARERTAAAQSIRAFLHPQSVAVIGASRNSQSIGGLILKNIIECGYKGAIYPINPNATEIQGLRCYKSLDEIPQKVDLAVVTVPAAAVEEVMKKSAELGIAGAVVISAGFSEVGGKDRSSEKHLREIASDAGMRLVGPNCMGILTTHPEVSLNATFAPVWPPSGNVSILSQSGALGLMILDYARNYHIGVRSFFSVGNKADVSGNDLLCFWAEDPGTKVIALYLESFGDPGRFARIAPRVAYDKPIVAVKSGRSAAGRRAAASHTAALASLDIAVEALFEQAGVIRTDTLEEMFDVISLLSTQPIPRGPRVAIVTNAGGPGILLADALDSRGLQVQELTPETREKLREFLPPAAALSNPVDMIASASPEDYLRTIEIVGNDPSIDALVVIYIPPLVSQPNEVAEAIAAGAAKVPSDIPVLNVFLSSKKPPEALHKGSRGEMPCFTFPENAASALSRAEWYGRWRQKPVGEVLTLDPFSRNTIRSVIDRVLQDSATPTWLAPQDLQTVLKALQINQAANEQIMLDQAPAAAERLGYPLVAKIVSDKIIHKSDAGCVILNIRSKEDVIAAIQKIKDNAKRAGVDAKEVLLQRQVAGQIEMLVGVSSDPLFGPLIVCGLGGVHVEIFKDAAFRLPPVSDVAAEEMLQRLHANRILQGYRGAPAGDSTALKDILMKISCLVEIVPEIRELDLNPVKVLEPGQGAVVVDARMRIGRINVD
ncbi:MAG: GNAT family N-acetyltransferase, partial [Bdellovibrionales bacterium]|nr:GNAT family N-acetyltransferase [Bdellovibrionales bacterium]